jgi:hypothetical protein
MHYSLFYFLSSCWFTHFPDFHKCINRLEEGNSNLLSSKEFCKFKSFWCLAAKNLLIQNKMKGSVLKKMNSWRTLLTIT